MSEKELYEICKSLCKMGAGAVIISGLERGEFLENFVFERGKEPQIIKQRKVGSCRAGTGDVFSSIIASDIVNGFDLSEAVRHASAFIAKALSRTEEMGLPETDGICFEEFLTEIQKI